MDRLQFNGWHIDGWMVHYSQDVMYGGALTINLDFDIAEGALRNGDERIWFIPDPVNTMGLREFQGALVNLNMTETRPHRLLGGAGAIERVWGLVDRRLELSITGIVHPDSPEFDPDFVNRDYHQIQNVQIQNRPPDPDMEKKLAEEQIARECEKARKIQEEINYRNFPKRLDSID